MFPDINKKIRGIKLEKQKTRSYLFDNIKAFLIFGVVYVHFIRVSGEFAPDGLDGYFYTLFFSFIMQGFIFVSGYFSKNVEKCRKGAFLNYLFPYFIWMVGMYFIRFLISQDATLRLYHPSHGMWFFLVMFFYRFFLKDFIKVPHILEISMGVYFVAGCIPFLNETLSLGRAFSFLFFFLLGYYCRESEVNKIKKINPVYTICGAGALLVVLYIISKFQMIPVEMWHLKDGYKDYQVGNIEGMFLRLCIGIISLLWILILINLTPDRKLSTSEIGQHTLPIFVLHIPLRYLIQEVGIPLENDFLICMSCAIITSVTVYFLSRPCVHRIYNSFFEMFHFSGLKSYKSIEE